jgi:hypothetical protein
VINIKMASQRFQNKVVFATGGTGGLGAATVAYRQRDDHGSRRVSIPYQYQPLFGLLYVPVHNSNHDQAGRRRDCEHC